MEVAQKFNCTLTDRGTVQDEEGNHKEKCNKNILLSILKHVSENLEFSNGKTTVFMTWKPLDPS